MIAPEDWTDVHWRIMMLVMANKGTLHASEVMEIRAVAEAWELVDGGKLGYFADATFRLRDW